MLIKTLRAWEIPENVATSEQDYLNRREFLKRAGIGAAALVTGMNRWAGTYTLDQSQVSEKIQSALPAPRNTAFTLDRPVTEEYAATHYNNFYEFTTDKPRVAERVDKFKIFPWQIEISGHVEKKLTLDLDDLVQRLPVEERLYRHRCVEAWSMAVPWSGIPFKTFIELVQPTAKAKYVRFVTFNRPEQAPGMKEQPWYPWPYYEGLRMDEAMNELTFLAIGLYGKPLPKQNGAPVRMVLPWKYGYKSIKSIVKIEFVDQQPKTFWNDLAPTEYSFLSNVNPKVPHPRWSQAEERVIPSMERRPTLLFNGYEEFVASMYR